ncbi:sulfurtransferase complex subunit TusD [Ningiella sp. W23]|uniref:sulfurtransferase complex subunit TusD n=1 Tax=Ningiella sp. W23 TaxID=3023715 RepID=UPI003757DA4C
MPDKPTFAIFVTSSPYDSRNGESASRFCLSALKAGYEVEQVFFYQAGVQHASKLLEVNSDEVDMRARWQSIAQKHQVALNVCVTAGAKRGLCEKNLAAHFRLVGISEYFATLRHAQASGHCIKSVQF